MALIKVDVCTGNKLRGTLGPLASLTRLVYLDCSGNQCMPNLSGLLLLPLLPLLRLGTCPKLAPCKRAVYCSDRSIGCLAASTDLSRIS